MARKTYNFHGSSNVLATVPSEPEIIAVFPELSSTIITHQQDIRLRRGDTLDIYIQVQNDYDPPEIYNINDCILRWGVKQGFGDTESPGVVVGNEGLLILKKSYNQLEIKLTNPANGQAIVYLNKTDTAELSFSPTVWELEITKPISKLIPPSGTSVRLLANSPVIRANGFRWDTLGIQAGHIIETQGRKILVNQVVSYLDIEADFLDWVSEPNAPFQAWRTNVKTVASGTFQVQSDVII